MLYAGLRRAEIYLNEHVLGHRFKAIFLKYNYQLDNKSAREL